MANITKADLVAQVAAQSGADKTTTAAVLKAFEETIAVAVKRGDAVSLSGFLSFKQGARAAGTARNPQTGATVKVKAKKVPRISAGATFKKIVNNEAPAPTLAKLS